jgi:small ligand-binding sensory domain FIST
VTAVAVGLSEHPVPAQATGDALGAVLDEMGTEADLVWVFVTGNHAGALDDVTRAAARVLKPRTLVGAASSGVVGGRREVEDAPGIVVCAMRCGAVTPVRLRAARMEKGWSVGGMPTAGAEGHRTLLLVADPHTFPADGLLDHLAGNAPGLVVVGGLVAGVLGRGGARLVLDGEEHTHGAVGVLLDPECDVTPVVSQGCRPIGDPYVVTNADGRHILGLAGRPAIERLRELLEDLDPADRLLATSGLRIGMVLDEGRATFDQGDFLVRPVSGVDMATGVVSIGERVEVGRTVQFQLRDSQAASADLRRALDERRADGALVFTCASRGSRLFGRPDHDAEVSVESLGTRAVGGMFSAGEMGPVGDRSLVHSASMSMALFGGRAA